jgi:hypothetical protein
MAGLHSCKWQAILPPIFSLLLLISFGMLAMAEQREGPNFGGSPPQPPAELLERDTLCEIEQRPCGRQKL